METGPNREQCSEPIAMFRQWLAAAEQENIKDHNAIALATADRHGMPNVRMVLLKDVEDDAFVFFTNYGSAKAAELSAGRAAFVLYWRELNRQIRARGIVEKLEADLSDRYFASRPLQSRYGAWASRQSSPLKSKAQLVARAAKIALRYGNAPPRPSFWGGYRLRPLEIEFWSEGDHRLHDRFRWTRSSPNCGAWEVCRLCP
ncbi:MAG: pyridoxamine 5'-phosphate oxidase [Rhodobacteraceae bacterium]|nr:pyridoxamine 5'-phosphate oxidase [Paracoccaceae bacterium]